jgi:hypothetical protein
MHGFSSVAPAGVQALAGGGFGRVSPCTRKLSADPGSMTLLSIITTSDRDRAGDVVVPQGLRNLDEYLRNPVVLWAHNRVALPPIGVCVRLDVQPDRIVAETRFAQGMPLAEDLFRLYAEGVLRGWSIGFLPRKAQLLPDTEGGLPGRPGLRIEEWDLLEYSAVPIPENPGALTLALQKGLVHDGQLRDWLAAVSDNSGGPTGSFGAARRQPTGAPLLKAGRVLARRNEDRLRQACDHLSGAKQLLDDVLAELEPEDEDDTASIDPLHALLPEGAD